MKHGAVDVRVGLSFVIFGTFPFSRMTAILLFMRIAASNETTENGKSKTSIYFLVPAVPSCREPDAADKTMHASIIWSWPK